MKYLIITLFFFASTTIFAQKMTRDYGYVASKDSRFSEGDIYVGVLLGTNSIPPKNGYNVSTSTIALKLVYNTDDIFFPLTIGRTYEGNYDFTVGAGYRKRFRKMYVHTSSNIRYTTSVISFYEYFGMGLNMGCTREFGNNLVLTVEFGPGFYGYSYVDYDSPVDPVTFLYPMRTESYWSINSGVTLAYRI